MSMNTRKEWQTQPVGAKKFSPALLHQRESNLNISEVVFTRVDNIHV